MEYSNAEFWDRLVQTGPQIAYDRSTRVLGSDDLTADERALAGSARSRALFELGRLPEALEMARTSLAISISAPASVRAAVALSASVVLAESGQVDEALAELADLARDRNGVELGRIRLQTAYVLHHAGRLHEALSQLDLSENLFRDGGEQRDRLRVHQNRGLVLLQQGRLSQAESDFVLAGDMARALGMTTAEAQSVANIAVLHGRARRLSESLRMFREGAALFERAGNPHRAVALMEIDRAEVMMHSGLLTDAVDAGRAAIRLVEPSGNLVLLGDAHLLVARAELAAGELRRASRSAERAAEIFDTSGRADMVAQAESVDVTARLFGERDPAEVRDTLQEAAAVIERLRSHGWDSGADDLAMARVRAGERLGMTDEIRADVDRLRRGISDGQRHTALAGWFAQAVSHELDGDPQAALDACRNGLERLDDIVAEAETLEQRSATMRLGHDLSQLTIQVAIDQRDAHTILAAAEGTRARALHDELAGHDRHRPLTDEGAGRLREELVGRLDDRILIEWVVARDGVWAVVLDARSIRLVHVGDRGDITRARDRALMWLDLAGSEPDASSAAAARAASVLDDQLIAPLDLPSDCGIVMVPVDRLHGIPWSGLPSFAGRPVTMTPNAQVWLEADRRATSPCISVGLVVGPGIGFDAPERTAIGRHGPAPTVASGAGATPMAVRSMFAGCDLVHVAAHGTFRSDHPLLSTLRLQGGDATLYDAMPDRVRSKLVVLSSCEGGAHGTADGSEVLGMSSVLLARGAAAVVAPLTLVRELECAEFVAEVHHELADGSPVACALADVRERWLGDDDLSRWAVASSFSCFGSDRVTVGDR